MRITILVTIVTSLFWTNAFSQKFEPSILSSQGGISSSGHISLEWTLGEPVIESGYAAHNMYTQGFHQPIIILTKGFAMPAESPVAQLAKPGIKVLVAPNPVQSLLSIRVERDEPSALRLTLTDIYGRILLTRIAESKNIHTQFSTANILPGSYFLIIKNLSGEIVHTTKIIKIN